MNQLSSAPSVHLTADACLADITPPTFSGISALSANTDGSLLASWGLATDGTGPVEYDVFIQEDTATALFTSANIVLSTFALSTRIYTTPDTLPLAPEVLYFVGVRARDRVGNQETNTVSMSAATAGVSLTALVQAIQTLAKSQSGGTALEAQSSETFMESDSNETFMEVKEDEETI